MIHYRGHSGIPNPSVVGTEPVSSTGVLAQDAAAPSPPTNQLSLNQFFGVRGAPNGATTPTPGTLRSLLNPLQKHHRAQAKQETRVVAGAESRDLTGQGQGTPVNPNVPFVPSISAAGTAAPWLQAWRNRDQSSQPLFGDTTTGEVNSVQEFCHDRWRDCRGSHSPDIFQPSVTSESWPDRSQPSR